MNCNTPLKLIFVSNWTDDACTPLKFISEELINLKFESDPSLTGSWYLTSVLTILERSKVIEIKKFRDFELDQKSVLWSILLRYSFIFSDISYTLS